MSKVRLAGLSLVTLLVAGGGSVPAAEEPTPTAEELTLWPGDTVTWTPAANSPHKVRFGGTVTHGGTLSLTPFADVQKVLGDFDPSLKADAGGIATTAQGGVKVTAKVKADAATSGVSEFFFTCGFLPHSNGMVTVSFKIAPSTGQAPRNIQIISAPDLPLRWVLQTTPGNPKGDRSLKRP